MSFLNLLVAGLFPAVVIFAALRDATTMTIPNWLCGVGALMFVPAALISGMNLGTAGIALAVGFASLVAGIGMFAARWVGGGDAKLFAVCGLWLGWPSWIEFIMWTAIAGGGLAIALIGSRKLATLCPVRMPSWTARLLSPGGDIPYGIAICVGALCAFPDSPVMHSVKMAGGL
jgi:prepilin peptidase CpaA